MDSNSPKPSQTGIEEVSALKMLRGWLEQVGGNQRIPQVLDLLAEHAAAGIQAGSPGQALDADTLRRFHSDRYGGRIHENPASRWLSSTSVQRWWEQRQSPLEQACREAGLGLMPVLSLQAGGGRGNTTQYRLEFRALTSTEEVAEEREDLPDSVPIAGLVRYQTEPVKPAWWLKPIIGDKPFRMRSWRGYLLIGVVLGEALIVLLLWAAVLLTLRGPRPIGAGDLGAVLTTTLMTVVWLHWMKPLIRLPIDRVTIANDLLLAWSQLNGQLRMVRDAKSKAAGGWFQFVRHYGTCPICAGEVEIADGGKAFPGRLVGRCSDSPMEHVFSFDPTSMAGRQLIGSC
jgi:hypothetical protein